MKYLYLYIVLCIVFWSASAHAADDRFIDWPTTQKYLESNGIQYNAINWQPIEMACLGLKTDENERLYNQCLYEKARDSRAHDADYRGCSVRASAKYPDRLTTENTTGALLEQRANGTTRQVETIAPPISLSELNTARNAATIECMQSLGWVSADDFMLGKRCAQ